ncbi:capsular polysaccharide biosynthesis protein [Bordetella pertussis]|nr:capsular polysaccharide biosynthesis protein [Bordetella pertussis]
MPELLDYVRRYPHTELFQVLVARALEAAHRSDEGLAVWRGIHQRFPDSSEAFILMLRGVKRQQGIEAGRAEIELYFSGGSSSAASRPTPASSGCPGNTPSSRTAMSAGRSR